MTIEACIAANRFGLGATPGQLTTIARDPKAWLLRQTMSPQAALVSRASLASSAQAFRNFLDYSQTRRDARRDERAMAQPPMPKGQGLQGVAPQGMKPENMGSNLQDQAAGFVAPKDLARALNLGARAMGEEVDARMVHALTTQAPFLERWALFWSNALTMSAKNLQTNQFPGPYEREAIRPNILGKFSDLLKSSALHLGMLVYLDQVRSIGPNSPAAQNAISSTQRRVDGRTLGLNENLAREILELHTVGPDGGYTQADVTEFARALTGWTVLGPRNRRPANGQEIGSVIFVPPMHEPGERMIMDQRFAEKGGDQARDILDFLAKRPETARRIANAIATHFVSDTPPPTLVNRLEHVFMQTDGDLRALAQALINSPEAWEPSAQKFKTPNEFLLSTLRASGTRSVSVQALRNTFEQLGQPPWRAPSPKGWPDTADKWASPDAILKRVDWSNLAADAIGETMSPIAFAEGALGATLTPATRTAISRAGDARQGIVLALMSPEFQRR